MVEHVLCKHDVRSSNLLTSTNLKQLIEISRPFSPVPSHQVLVIDLQRLPKGGVHQADRQVFDNDIIVEQTSMTIFK